MERPTFLEPSDDFGAFKETSHSVKAQAERLERMIRIEQGIHDGMHPLHRSEQQRRIDRLIEMRKATEAYAFALWKKERGN